VWDSSYNRALMSKRLPIDIDPLRLIEQRIFLSGEMLLKQFPRLKELLATDSGAVTVDLAFDRTDITHLPVVTGRLQSKIELICQRCLKSVPHIVDCDINLVFVTTDAEAERLQSDYDTWLVDDDRIFLQDFIEDEILLGLPHSALHDECEPSRPLVEALPEEMESQQKEVENPFAILKDLQK